jgi:tetratricopeptide (TPR) repeat protein
MGFLDAIKSFVGGAGKAPMHKATPLTAAGVADALYQTLVIGANDSPFEPSLIPARRRSQFERQLYVYRLAAVHMAIFTQQDKHPDVLRIGDCLFALTRPNEPLEIDRERQELTRASNCLIALLEEVKGNAAKGMRWGQAWLKEINMDASNPILCSQVGLYWLRTLTAAFRSVNIAVESRSTKDTENGSGQSPFPDIGQEPKSKSPSGGMVRSPLSKTSHRSLPAGPDSKTCIQVCIQRAGAAFQRGDFDQGIRDCAEAIRLDPRNAEAYNIRGAAYGSKRDWDKAIADLNKAIRLDPKNAEAYYNRGRAYLNKGDMSRTIADCTKAIWLDPKDADKYVVRGVAHGIKGDIDASIADFTEAIRRDSQFAMAFNNRGLAYGNKGDWHKAIADYSEAIWIDSQFATAYYNRGIARWNIGETADANRDFEKAKRLGFEPETESPSPPNRV